MKRKFDLARVFYLGCLVTMPQLARGQGAVKAQPTPNDTWVAQAGRGQSRSPIPVPELPLDNSPLFPRDPAPQNRSVPPGARPGQAAAYPLATAMGLDPDTRLNFKPDITDLVKGAPLDLTVDVDVTHDQVAALLSVLALRGNVAVSISADVSGGINNLHLSHVAPETAIERVATAAGLRWRLFGKTYIITGGPATAAPAGGVITVQFKDTPATEILRLVAEAGKMRVDIAGEVTEKIGYIRLQDIAPQEAVQTIAETAGLKWRAVNPSFYIVGKVLPPEPIPEPQLIPLGN